MGKTIKTSQNGGGGIFLGNSLIIIKWTWGFFFPKFAIWPHAPTVGHKRVQYYRFCVSGALCIRL